MMSTMGDTSESIHYIMNTAERFVRVKFFPTNFNTVLGGEFPKFPS